MRLFGLGPTELVVILLIVLLLFGPKQLPKLGKMFGKTMRNVRDGMEGKLEDGDDEEEPAAEKSDAEKSEATSDKES
jgi:sec-independent protein translocase protein TatA